MYLNIIYSWLLRNRLIAIFFTFIIASIFISIYATQNNIQYFVFALVISFSVYKTRSLLFSKKYLWLKIYFCFYFFMLINGIIKDNFKSFFYSDLIIFASPVIILGYLKSRSLKNYTFYIPLLVNVMNCILLLCAYYVFFKYNFGIASAEKGRIVNDIADESVTIMSPKNILTFSYFLFPLILYVQKKQWIFYLSMISFLVFSFMMASRGTTLFSILIILLTIYSVKKIRLNKIIYNLSLFVIFIFILLQIRPLEDYKAGLDYLINRYEGEYEEFNPRDLESFEIWESLSDAEKIFGKGLGASNNSFLFKDTPHGVNLVHYGYMFYILKGGIVFLAFFYLSLFYFIFFFWKRNYKPYAIIIIAFLLFETSHSFFSSFTCWIILGIPLSFYFFLIYNVNDSNLVLNKAKTLGCN